MSKTPLVLYDINSNVIPVNGIATSNNFFIRSFQFFTIAIVETEESNNFIYSVKKKNVIIDPNELFDITKNKSFELSNFSYTLYLQSDCTILTRDNDGVEMLYQISFKPDNILTDHQEHYNDLLINNHLPTLEELYPAIISKDKADIIKRLLLDFKYLINKKGTVTGIKKFLNLIGFAPNTINVYEEYKTPSGALTILPNKLVDIKTGYYHLLYDNWIVNPDDKYTNKNMPKRLLAVTDLTDFFEKLWNALILANIYFTLPEQDISFFGMTYSSNNEQYLSVAGNTTEIHENDVHYFQRSIHINLYNQHDETGTNKMYLVKNNIQYIIEVPKTSVRIFNSDPTSIPPNSEVYLIEREIFDGEEITDPLLVDKIQTVFGNIIHLEIKSPGTYWEYIIENINNPFVKITGPKVLLNDEAKIIFVSKPSGNYKVTVYVYDGFNNREKYVYLYNLSNINPRIDIIPFNSTKVYDDEINTVDSGIDSPSNTIIKTPNNLLNYVLAQKDVPNDLVEYYTKDTSLLTLTYLTNNERFEIKEINKNYMLDSVTETIPLDFVDNWLHIIAIPYLPNYKLCLRIVDEYTLKTKLVPYYHSSVYKAIPDLLYITAMDINDQETNTIIPYIFISTIESSIDLNIELFDLVMVPDYMVPDRGLPSKLPAKLGYFGESILSDSNDINILENEIIRLNSMFNIGNDTTESNNPLIKSIYDLTEDLDKAFSTKIPVNYDFPLFFRPSELVPGFINWPVLPTNDQALIIKSIYPRLTGIDGVLNFYNVTFGDVLVCIINEKYISNYNNIIWSVYNAFNGKLLYSSTDYLLKYRISEQTVYDIVLEFQVDETKFKVTKKSLITSF